MGGIKYLFFYLIVINIAAFFTYGIDKRKARRNAWRIPEKTLLGLAALGGGAGAWAGMLIFHHKTRKLKFAAGVPLIMAAEYGLLWYFLR